MPHVYVLALSFDGLQMINFLSAVSSMTPFVFRSFQASFTQDKDLVCWYCRGASFHISELSVSLSLVSVPLHLSASPLPTLLCPLGISSEHPPPPHFFHESYEREGGGEKTDE